MKTLTYTRISRQEAQVRGYLPTTDPGHDDVQFDLVRTPDQPLGHRPSTHPSLLVDVMAVLGPVAPVTPDPTLSSRCALARAS